MEAPVTTKLERSREAMLVEGREFGHYLLARNPFIKLLSISGSLSNPQRNEHDDIDFFIISRVDHVWECFILCLWYGFRYARKHRRPRTHFCFNYVIDERYAAQEIESTEKAANEYLNIVVLFGHDTYREILQQRKEMERFFPERYQATLERFSKNAGSKYTLVKKTPLFLKMIRPLVQALILFMSWRRKIRRERLTGNLLHKIYANRHVIRSHFYE